MIELPEAMPSAGSASTSETQMSQSGGEFMPVVSRRPIPGQQFSAQLMPSVPLSIASTRCVLAGNQTFRALLAVVIGCGFFSNASAAPIPLLQDEQAAETSNENQEKAETAAATGGAATAPPEESAATNYSDAIEKQQQWTRDLRNESKPLLTGDYEAEYVKIRSAYNSILSNGGSLNGGKDLETVQKALELRILRAADPAIQQDVQQIKSVLEEVRRELARAGGAITNPQTKQRFRQDYCREVLNVLKKLLDNNWEARSFALSLMPDLEVVPSGFNSKRIEVYEPVYTVLTEVLTDAKGQPDSIHMRAAAEISRLLKKTDSAPLQQMKLAGGLASELSRNDTEIAYQLELVRALSLVTEARERVGRQVPTVLLALVKAMSDDNRHILVRCEAAKGIGRAGFDPQINFEPLAWKTVQLSVQAGAFYNRNRNPQLQWVFSLSGADLYFAFHHEDADLQSGRNPQGMLNRAPRSELVSNGYQQLLKIAPRMWFGESIPNSDLIAVNKWVSENKPANLTWDANAPPVTP
jgi:hypothetical protein